MCHSNGSPLFSLNGSRIAGLHLAALSLQGRTAAAFVAAFSGSYCFVLDDLGANALFAAPLNVPARCFRDSIKTKNDAECVSDRRAHSACSIAIGQPARLIPCRIVSFTLDMRRNAYPRC
jgi:hypothetical protein